jgi:multicomponent Na+:H+ antiporter subunit B
VTARTRHAILLPALAGLAALLVWALAGLPDFGHYRGPYGYVINKATVPERHVTNAVAATVFDYRGFDTMGEEFILFGAVVGVMLLLRATGKEEKEREEQPSEAAEAPILRLLGSLMVGVAVLIGLWIVSFGYLTPGGGFQGGVVLAGGILLLYLVGGHKAFHPFGESSATEPMKGVGAGAYVAIGLAALVTGASFLHNIVGLGVTGTLWSSGTIGLLNWATALEVCGALLLLFSEFLDEYIVPLGGQ